MYENVKLAKKNEQKLWTGQRGSIKDNNHAKSC